MSSKVTIYTPESKAVNIREMFGQMIHGAIKGRFLAYRLFRRDLKADFSDSFLGYSWNFANPLIMAFLFLAMKKGGIVDAGNIEMPYEVFVIFGMLIFQVFIQSINFPLTLIQRSQSLISQVKVHPESLIGSLLLRLCFDSFFYIPIFAGTLLYCGMFSFYKILLIIISLPSVILLGASFGILLSPFNVIFTDFSKFVANLTRPLLFITPTFYRHYDHSPILQAMVDYNPLSILMNNVRALSALGVFHSMEAFFVVIFGSTCVLLIGWVFFHLSIPIISDKT